MAIIDRPSSRRATEMIGLYFLAYRRRDFFMPASHDSCPLGVIAAIIDHVENRGDFAGNASTVQPSEWPTARRWHGC